MDMLKALGRKLFLFGLVIVLVIPVSVKLSNLIEDTYQASIQNTIETAKDAAQEAQTEEGSDEENSSLFSWIGNGISNVTSGITEKVGGIINNFLEALAVVEAQHRNQNGEAGKDGHMTCGLEAFLPVLQDGAPGHLGRRDAHAQEAEGRLCQIGRAHV